MTDEIKKPDNKRWVGIGACLLILAAVSAMLWHGAGQSADNFLTPMQYHLQLAENAHDKTKPTSIGGLILEDSIYKMKEGGIGFIIADNSDEIHAEYHGALPKTFHGNQAIVAQGAFNAVGVLEVTSILAIYDEKAMPPAFAAQLKQTGQQQGKDKGDEDSAR